MRVKICGLTSEEAVASVCDAGADVIGLVFTSSPRQIDFELGRRLRALIPSSIQVLGVFRSPDLAWVQAALETGIDGVQADASWAHWGALPASVVPVPAFKDGVDLKERVARWPRHPVGAIGLGGSVLIDGPRGGGLGIRAEAHRVAEVAARRPVVLAGGLNPANLTEAIRVVRPWGVDVSSGVESSPGVKDPARVAAFVHAARHALEGE